MSFDNVSQTSDYSSSSEKSSTRPTVIPLYRSHMLNNFSCSDRGTANRTSHMPDGSAVNPYSHQSRVSRTHAHSKVDSQQNCEVNLKLPVNGFDNHSNSINSQMKAIICENAMLKKEVKVLQDKCQKIDLCERQFVSLQTQYQEFVKSSSNRQALERQLRLQLENDLKEAQKANSHQMLPRPKVSNFSQTDEIDGNFHEKNNREQQLTKEVSALRLMLREKEELILSLLSERNSKSTAFCPEDYDEDYITSNIVSL